MDEDRLTFFLAGSGEAEASSKSEAPLADDRLLLDASGRGEGGASSASAPETASKRSSISFLIAS